MLPANRNPYLPLYPPSLSLPHSSLCRLAPSICPSLLYLFPFFSYLFHCHLLFYPPPPSPNRLKFSNSLSPIHSRPSVASLGSAPPPPPLPPFRRVLSNHRGWVALWCVRDPRLLRHALHRGLCQQDPAGLGNLGQPGPPNTGRTEPCMQRGPGTRADIRTLSPGYGPVHTRPASKKSPPKKGAPKPSKASAVHMVFFFLSFFFGGGWGLGGLALLAPPLHTRQVPMLCSI